VCGPLFPPRFYGASIVEHKFTPFVGRTHVAYWSKADIEARYHLPAIYPFRFYAVDGGLLSYGFDFNEPFRRAPSYVDKILKGANPADLPIQQPTKFELVINLKTAKALGLTIQPQLLDRADDLIE